MVIEERVKEHIKDLQRRIKVNIVADAGGRVRLRFLKTILLCSHNVSAVHRGSRGLYPIVVLRKAEETEALYRGEPLCGWCIHRPDHEQCSISLGWRIC